VSAAPATSRAVVLLSGGLDSATTLAIAGEQGFDCAALTFRYGQRHAIEVEAAKRIARAFGAERHIIAEIDLRVFGGSAITGALAVPKDRSESEMAQGIPVTYVPARNLVFLSYAVGCAESIGARDVFIGVNAVDYSGYPDCRAEFIRSFEQAANLGTCAGVQGQGVAIRAPLIDMSKSQIIRRGVSLGVDYGLTVSCYDPDVRGSACGRCDACTLRRLGFDEAGIEDPATRSHHAAGSRP